MKKREKCTPIQDKKKVSESLYHSNLRNSYSSKGNNSALFFIEIRNIGILKQ